MVLPSQVSDTGASNQRRIAALQCGKESGFEAVQGLLNRIMDVLGVPLNADFAEPLPGRADLAAAHFGGGYSWQPSEVGDIVYCGCLLCSLRWGHCLLWLSTVQSTVIVALVGTS